MLYKRLIINGKEYLLAVSQAGSGAPAATDPGSPGILYMDTDTGDLYKCSGGEDGAWAWKKLSEGGSGYELPVGGENLGGVKNGGNVVINEDGTMTAPGSSSSQNVDLTGYAKEKWVQDNYQPKGNYLTEVPSGYATEEFVKNKIAEAELGGEEVDLSGYAQKSELPTKVSQLQNDSGYLTEHQDISGKLDASALPTAIDTALAQAKASGEFDGKDGADGQPGKDGADGAPGAKGDKGDKGDPGEKGDTGEQGIQGIPGDKGDKGDTGATGSAGKDGKTPVKGVDYWTEADQESIVQQVITALGTPVFGTVDADNNIILTGNLADGTYMLMYERADGERVEIGTVEIGGIAYTNLIKSAEALDSTALYNGNGYKNGYYASSASPYESTDADCVLTGLIPYDGSFGAEILPDIYIKGATIDTSQSHVRFQLWKDDKTYINGISLTTNVTIETLADSYYKLTFASNIRDTYGAFGYIRLSLLGTGDNLIVTVGEPIE